MAFGWGTNSVAWYTDEPITGYPFTLSIWAFSTTTGTNRTIAGIGTSSGSSSAHSLEWRTSDGFAVSSTLDGTVGRSSGGTGFALNTWHHVLGIFRDGRFRLCYVNGSSGNPNTGTVNYGQTNRVSAVRNFVNGSGQTNVFVGYTADFAAWNAELNLSEITALSKGISPAKIRTSNLQIHVPCIRELISSKINADWTTSGTRNVVEHPRTYR